MIDDMEQYRTAAITILLGAICGGAWYLIAQEEDLDKSSDPRQVASSTDTVVRQGDGSSSELPDLHAVETARVPHESVAMPGEPAPATTEPPDEVTQAVSHEDVLQIQSHLDLLYATADREALLRDYKDLMQRLPETFAKEAHDRKLASGEYTVVGQASPPPTDGGDDIVRVPKGSGGSRDAFGLVRMHRLESGEMVETRIELAELGQDGVIAVKVAWFQSNVGRRR